MGTEDREIEKQDLEKTNEEIKLLYKELARKTNTLEATKASFHSIVERSPDGIVVVDGEGKVCFVNTAFCSIFGKKATQFLDRFFSVPLPTDGMAEIDIIRDDGKPGTGEMRVSPTEWKGKKARLAMVRDITKRKRAEEALREAKAETEDSARKLRETTAQLIQTEKLTALGEMAAGVAHEIRQPLNGIKIICQAQLRDIRKNRFVKASLSPGLSDVISLVNRMAVITDQMCLFVRRRDVESIESVDVNGAIEGLFKLIGQQLRDHDIEVVRGLSRGLPEVSADSIKLEQVLMNLVLNARHSVMDFRTEGMKIEIRSYLESDALGPDHPAVIIEIKDNGRGIAEEIKNRLFEPFFTTKKIGMGTGLGLSISQRIVREWGGKIEFQSKEGKGASFRVILPAPARLPS